MAAAVAHSHMHAGSDMTGPSFASRRQNAGNLPAFELPPPPINSSHKYQYTVHAGQGSQTPGNLASVGNLLTPPSTVGGQDVSPSPTGTVPSLSTHVPTAPQPPQQPHHHHHQQQQQYSNGYASWSPSPSIQPAYYSQQAPAHSYAHSRLPYSPAPSSLRGGSNPHSPNANDGAAMPSTYDLPPYPASAPLTPAAVQPISTSQGPSHHQLHPGMLGSGTPVTTASTHPSPVHAQDGFRAPPTPTYYSQHPQPHSPFPYSNGPQQQMTLSSTGPMMSRPQISPATTGPMSNLPSPALHSPAAMQGRFASYAPMMSSMHHHNGQPMMVGALPHGMVASFNSGHAASMQMYGSPAPTAQPQNDRPFKCDQCPQSFNRNHDLKRHKRIHLAVKPFPCGHCDKSFSRKDALKRHILVKGCGKLGEATTPAKADSVVASVSPTTKNAVSDSDEPKVAPTH